MNTRNLALAFALVLCGLVYAGLQDNSGRDYINVSDSSNVLVSVTNAPSVNASGSSVAVTNPLNMNGSTITVSNALTVASTKSGEWPVAVTNALSFATNGLAQELLQVSITNMMDTINTNLATKGKQSTLNNIDTATTEMSGWSEGEPSSRCAVNPISSQVGIAGNTGLVSATTTRVTIGTNDLLIQGMDFLTNGYSVANTITTAGAVTSNLVKASAGKFIGFHAGNTNAATAYYFKLYDLAAAATPSTKIPIAEWIVPGTALGGNATTVVMPPGGITCVNGIFVAITRHAATNDNTAVAGIQNFMVVYE